MGRSKNVGGVQVRDGVREGKEQRQPRLQVKDVTTGLLVLSQHLGLVNNKPQ